MIHLKTLIESLTQHKELTPLGGISEVEVAVYNPVTKTTTIVPINSLIVQKTKDGTVIYISNIGYEDISNVVLDGTTQRIEFYERKGESV